MEMIEIFLFGIVLGLIPITLAGLFVTAYLQYRRGDQLDLWLINISFFVLIDLLFHCNFQPKNNKNGITLCRIWTYDIGFWRPTFYRTELRALSYQNRKEWKEKDSFSNPNPFESISIDSSLLLLWGVIGRDDRIWTRDILYPKQTRYQAALHPFHWSTVSL